MPRSFGLLRRSKKELKTVTRRLVNLLELEYGLLVDSLGPDSIQLKSA